MRLYRRNEITEAIVGTALSADGVHIDFQAGADEKTAFIVNATAVDTITVVAGEGSINENNITLAVPKGISVFTLDSAFFMNAKGANKGKVTLKGLATTTVAPVVLP